MDFQSLNSQCKGGATSSFHPAMMLRELVSSYNERIIPSGRITKASGDGIHLIGVSGNGRVGIPLNRPRSLQLTHTRRFGELARKVRKAIG